MLSVRSGRQAWAQSMCDVGGRPQLPVLGVWTPGGSRWSRGEISGLSVCWVLPSAVWKEGWGDGRELNKVLGLKGSLRRPWGPVGRSEHCEQRSWWLGVSGKGRWNLCLGLGAFERENVIRDQILEALEILCEDVRSLFCKAVGSHLKFLGIIWIVSPLLKVVLIKDCKPPVSWRHWLKCLVTKWHYSPSCTIWCGS